MDVENIIKQIRIYAEEIDVATEFYNELSRIKTTSKIKKEEIDKQREYTQKEILRASYKLDKIIKKIELKEKPKK